MEELALVQLALMRTVVTIKHMTMLSALYYVVMSQIEKKRLKNGRVSSFFPISAPSECG